MGDAAGTARERTCLRPVKERFNGDSGGFLNHIQHDADPNNPFIPEGFKGTRGLNDVGQALATGPYPDPPKGVTQADLLVMAHDWVDASGGTWKGDRECGCTLQHYVLKIDTQTTSDQSYGGTTIRIAMSMAEST